MATKSAPKVHLDATLQNSVVAMVKEQIAAARQASGALREMQDREVIPRAWKRGETPDLVKGISGARNRANESLTRLEKVFFPYLDEEHRAEAQKAIDERFKKRIARQEVGA